MHWLVVSESLLRGFRRMEPASQRVDWVHRRDERKWSIYPPLAVVIHVEPAVGMGGSRHHQVGAVATEGD